MCFNMTSNLRSFDAAKAACEAMTGQLVMYTTAAKQLMVEQVRGGGDSGRVPRWKPVVRC